MDAEFPKIIRVVEEDLVTGTRVVKTGSVQVDKRTEQENKIVEFNLLKDVVDVHRVLVNKVVGPTPARPAPYVATR